jgi:integrase
MTTISLKYIDTFTDRHGQRRYYFRRNGRRFPLPGKPGSHEFMDAYANALAETGSNEVRVKRSAPAPRTFAALAPLYFQSAHFKGLSQTSRGNYRRIIDTFLAEHGHGRVDQFRRKHLIKIMGRMADRPGAAITLLKRIRTLVRFAIDLEWIETDPTLRVRSYQSQEFHTWTEEEIEQFEDRWPIGTKERLAFAIVLYTGQRVSDAHAMPRPDKSGLIRVVQQKTGTALVIPAHANLIAALDAMPGKHATMLTTAYGQPFSVKGFSQFLVGAMREAGLPARCVPHGGRKAAARRLAEIGCTPHEIMAITGHKTLSEVERYTRAAEQQRLAGKAMERLENNRLPNLGS